MEYCIEYISLVYSHFSNRVGLPLHNIPSSEYWSRSKMDPIPGVNHISGMHHCQIILLSVLN